jgi:1-deoxyxylulose-5-phosphate synthase
MEYRQLGRTGVLVSPLALGAMNFGGPTGKEESIAIILRALAGGINFVDTSNSYNNGESERLVGEALRQYGQRDQVFLATKVYNKTGEGPNDKGPTRFHMIKACEASLRRLQTDHIDLYQLHRPPLNMPQDETLRAFEDLVRAGKVIYIGCSTFPAWLIMEALSISERYGWVRYISEQPPYNLVDRRIENEIVPLCQRYGLAILPWSPLGGGILTGRYADGSVPEGSRATHFGQLFRERITASARQVGIRVAEMAQERGLSAAQLALLWVKDQPGVTSPIIGPRTMGHLESFLPVLDMKLADADRPLFDALVHPGNAVADFYNSNDWMKARVLE